jgi:peptide/nickel transport system permease protein
LTQSHLFSTKGWGGIFVGILLILLLVSFFYTPYDPNEMNIPQRLQPPSGQHWFGTDEFGRDLFSRILAGAQVSLLVGFLAALIAGLFGTLIGALSGYFGGWLDEVVMRFMDALMALPGIVMALLIISIRGPGLVNTALALGVMGIPSFARIVRSGFLQNREVEYVQAAIAIGATPWRIIFRHILPNQLTPIIVASSINLAAAILGEAGLSYLGLGIQPPDPSWGRMLQEGQKFIYNAPWYSIAPGLTITFTVFAFYLFSNDLQIWLHPANLYRRRDQPAEEIALPKRSAFSQN